MFRKVLLFIVIILVAGIVFVGFRFFTSNTAFEEKSKYFYVRTGHVDFESVWPVIRDSNYIKNPGSFRMLADRTHLWEQLKAGRYEIKKGMSLVDIFRVFRNGKQAPVNFVITKLRTREDLAAIIGKRLECDSASVMEYMLNEDTLRAHGFDTSTIMTAVLPNTYTYFWNTTPSKIFNKFYAAHEDFWNDERRGLAAQHGLTPITAYILASIVEEETTVNADKGNITSVYLNRFRKGMKLQADPTVKFALRNFALRRIYEKYLFTESPYNTYLHPGLPPGPICTPSRQTLEAVLHAPETNYWYFVAKSDFSGRHVFAETYDEHVKNANAFRQALDTEQLKRTMQKDSVNHP